MIALPYHPYFVRRLEEIHRLEKKELARHAPRPAARLGDKGKRPLGIVRIGHTFWYRHCGAAC
jgi:hypothetical protein